jgi:hypothetical protein
MASASMHATTADSPVSGLRNGHDPQTAQASAARIRRPFRREVETQTTPRSGIQIRMAGDQ